MAICVFLNMKVKVIVFIIDAFFSELTKFDNSVDKWTDVVTQAKAVVGRIKMRLYNLQEKHESAKKAIRYSY